MELDRASHAASRLRVFAAATLFSTGGAAFKLCGFTGWQVAGLRGAVAAIAVLVMVPEARRAWTWRAALVGVAYAVTTDRKSTRLNSSHLVISYAVFCLKKKTI